MCVCVCVCVCVSFIFQAMTHPPALFTDLGPREEVWKMCIFSNKCPFVEHQASVIFLTEVRGSLCQRETASLLNPSITGHKTSTHTHAHARRHVSFQLKDEIQLKSTKCLTKCQFSLKNKFTCNILVVFFKPKHISHGL